ncbi:hypothetical protein [Streptomyces bauhiniae]|uniref:hypothetical protein n=1 Tax=Streptomyces bauhiniae TaxID=2340725 RepID=UPI0035D95974
MHPGGERLPRRGQQRLAGPAGQPGRGDQRPAETAPDADALTAGLRQVVEGVRKG